MKKQQIVYIDVDKIHPHPKNPRKNLGDLTELAESIRVNGVLQNLTVVPIPDESEGDFYAVIGHRRRAGAIKASLKYVPCIISDMDEKTQVRTMLVENIQRSDLTVLEEAEGFQMMLDMGDSVTDISERTGFSKATVRSRVKLLGLDKDKFQKSVKRGATLQDFMALEKIKDSEEKNKILDAIGTSNFNYELKRTLDRQRDDENKAAAIKELKAFATQIEFSETTGLKKIQWISCGKGIQRPEDAGQRKYYFTVSYNITLYAEPTDQDQVELDAVDEKQRQKAERIQQLKEISDCAFHLRCEFIKNLVGLKSLTPVIYEMAVQTMLRTGYQYRFNETLFLDLQDLKDGKIKAFDFDMISESLQSSPERVLLMAAYANCGDSSNQTYHSRWMGEYTDNEALNMTYSYLGKLGYEMSDEERTYQDGTHELFTKHDESSDENG